jgi:hypothetical protein
MPCSSASGVGVYSVGLIALQAPGVAMLCAGRTLARIMSATVTVLVRTNILDLFNTINLFRSFI